MVQRHMPAVRRENFPICASPPGLQLARNSGAVTLITSRGVIACASCFNSSPDCSSSSPCVWARRSSGRRSTPIAVSIEPQPHPQNGSRSGAGGSLLARIAVAQQQNARASAAGAGMAHHRNDEAHFTGNLHPVRAQGRVRESALWPEQGDRQAPPLWFAAAVQTFLGNHAAVARSVSTRNVTAGTVSAIPDPDAAISLAWQHIVDNIHVALLMALAIAFFASLAIAHTLAPAQLIVAALQRMAHGQYRTSLRASGRWTLP